MLGESPEYHFMPLLLWDSKALNMDFSFGFLNIYQILIAQAVLQFANLTKMKIAVILLLTLI
jgi:hypothetical protein